MEAKGEDAIQAELEIWRIALGFVTPAVVRCAVKLGIADALDDHGGAMTLEELATTLDCSVPYLYRIMRFLVSKQVFKEETLSYNGKDIVTAYALTTVSRRLLHRGDHSMAALILLETSPVMMKAWYELSGTVRSNGTPAFTRANGEDLWSFGSNNPDQSHLFNEAMASDARVSIKALINECVDVFDGVRSIVDVGGGNGTAMAILVKAYPWIKAVNFDLPHVVNKAPAIDGVEHVEGDMFAKIPNADAVFLKYVLHDWNDEECIQILKNCKAALSKDNLNSKVIILDAVLNGDAKNKEYEEIRKLFDMLMIAHTSSGKERTEDEWKKVLFQAGFTSYKIKAIQAVPHVLIAYP